MAKKIYLLGGGSQELFEKTDKEALDEAKNKNIFVVNLTTNDEKKLNDKKEYLKNYFEKLGANKIYFASDYNDKEIKNKIKEVGLLFIAGGDTELLLDNIKNKKIDSLIKSFKGTIIGNSAGAYACCKEYIKLKDNKIEIVPSLGLLDFCCKAHYDSQFDSEILELSNERVIYGIPEGSLIISGKNKLSFIGDIYKFSNKQKEKIN